MLSPLSSDILRWEAICAAVWRRDKKNRRPHFTGTGAYESNMGKLYGAVSAHHTYLIEKQCCERGAI